jgi:hypothetical protein
MRLAQLSPECDRLLDLEGASEPSLHVVILDVPRPLSVSLVAWDSGTTSGILCTYGPPALIVFFILATGGSNFRGGKKDRRDNWYGLDTKGDFSDFRRWWHRSGKDAEGGSDLQNRLAAERAYADWTGQGKPKAK